MKCILINIIILILCFVISIDMYNCLKKLNIPCTLILDSAVGYIMERVDMVMVGAECVVESGGIINKVIKSYY